MPPRRPCHNTENDADISANWKTAERIDLPFERVHQRLDRRDMCLDACLDWKRLRRLDCVVHVGVMDREVNRLGPFGTVFKRAQFGNEIAPRDDTASRLLSRAFARSRLV